jgi:hypothetical protein
MHVAMEYHGKEDYLHVVYSGELTFHKKLLEDQSMLQALQKYKCSKVLLDIRQLKVAITTMDRYVVGEYFGKLTHSPAQIKTAILAQAGRIDGFVEIVAKNRGAMFEVFTDKETAVDWLVKN